MGNVNFLFSLGFKFPGAMFVAVVIAVVIAFVQAKWSLLSFIP
jgi:hypothetical protein